MRHHFTLGAFTMAVLLICGCSGDVNSDQTEMSTRKAPPELSPLAGPIFRKSLGNISFVGANYGTQSVIETDEGYQVTLEGTLPAEVKVGDWVDMIFANNENQGSPRFLCTKYTDHCLRISSMHKAITENPPVIGN